MPSNLPPGVTVSMIPGNTPEDEAWDSLFDDLLDSGLDPAEIRRRVTSPVWRKAKHRP